VSLDKKQSPTPTGKRLGGRGLEGLLPSAPPKPSVAAAPTNLAAIEEIWANREQPRKRFDDAALDELAASIKAVGVLEPILVRKRPQGGFEIIAGERRWRAAQKAGLKELPIFVREMTTGVAFEAAIIENLQREDLNPMEMARAFSRLIEDHKQTQDSVAAKIGKDRSTVANALRLLKLPKDVADKIENGELSEGHGRALLTCASPGKMSALAKQAIDGGWSVRETERRARTTEQVAPTPPKPKSANVKDLESRLEKKLGSRVSIEDREGKGTIEIRYGSLDELDRLLESLMR
jgi:ParB family transcriptional regulator, chromosome partitioning protein